MYRHHFLRHLLDASGKIYAVSEDQGIYEIIDRSVCVVEGKEEITCILDINGDPSSERPPSGKDIVHGQKNRLREGSGSACKYNLRRNVPIPSFKRK